MPGRKAYGEIPVGSMRRYTYHAFGAVRHSYVHFPAAEPQYRAPDIHEKLFRSSGIDKFQGLVKLCLEVGVEF